MRICFFIFTPSMAVLTGQLRDWLEARGGTFSVEDEAGNKHVTMTYLSYTLELWARHLRNVGGDQVWQVIPYDKDWRIATKFYRFLARRGVDVRSVRQVIEQYGASALEEYKWVCAGDDLGIVYGVDYDPAQTEIDNDIETTEEALLITV